MKSKILKLIFYYFIGFGLFYGVLYLTESLLLNIIGLSRNDIEIAFDRADIRIIQYTTIFFLICGILYIYDKFSFDYFRRKLLDIKKKITKN